MFCSRCGMKLENGIVKCPYCGNDMGVIYTEATVNSVPPKKYNMFTAYGEMFRRFADFNGRSSMREFWYPFFMNFIIVALFVIVIFSTFAVGITYGFNGLIIGWLATVLMIVYALIVWIPLMSLTIRRLHDSGKSGWFYLLSLIPEVGGIIVMVLCALKGQPGANKYGPNPEE